MKINWRKVLGYGLIDFTLIAIAVLAFIFNWTIFGTSRIKSNP